jgi:arylsulfatase A-like enzyme
VTPRSDSSEPSARSFSPPQFLDLDIHGAKLTAALIDTADDERPAFDALALPATPKMPAAQLRQGEWSDWFPLPLVWKDRPLEVDVRVHVIVLEETDHFVTSPPDVAERLGGAVDPMVDFVDNFPPQLIGDHDKRVWLDEARLSLAWHRDAVPALYSLRSPDAFVHNIYTPNQMLTARFWLGGIDPKSARYREIDEETRAQLWNEVLEVYRGVDEILGAGMAAAGEGAVIVLSSDHGAIPLDRSVRLNNLFARRGWLQYSLNPDTGEPIIDWNGSRVVFLTMAHVYIHPDGLGGDWHRASGERYEALREEVVAAIRELEDENGARPACEIVPWEEAASLRLPFDRVGDLVLANCPGYGWNEEITSDGAIFTTPPITGYKQAVLAADTPGMWTPFVIAGPGVKAGQRIAEPIAMVDQLPTILHLLKQPIPEHVQGRVIHEILE